MDRMASHISHVAFSSASDAFVEGGALESGERIGVDGVEEESGGGGNLSRGSAQGERVVDLSWKIEGS